MMFAAVIIESLFLLGFMAAFKMIATNIEQ